MSNVVFDTVKGMQVVPIADQFLREGKIFLQGSVDSETCNEIIRQLMYLEGNDEISEITIYIDSPGGNVTSGLSLYDCIRLVSETKPVKTVCLGLCASMGAILFLSADDRRIIKHGKIMIHDPAFGGTHDISYKKPHEIQSELDDLNQCREILGKIIAERTGMTLKSVYKLTAVDSYFSAEEAIEKNLATSIVSSIMEIK